MHTEDLEDLYEEAPCGSLSLSPDGRIVRANQTLGRWLNATQESLLDKPFSELLSFGGRIAFETHLAPLLRMQGFVEEIALDILTADGAKLPVIANAAEKRSPDGAHLFTRLTFLKAEGRRTYERTLQASLSKAEEAYLLEHEAAVLREQFIAVLGHDLRNPLAAIAAGVRLLQKHETLGTRGERVVQEMAASMARASSLIDNVMDFARNKLGNGLEINRDREASLTPVLEQVVNEIRSIAPERSVNAQFSIDEPVDCDRVKLGQLASNLLANAVTHGDPSQPITIRAQTTPTQLVLSVANGGIPLDAESQRKLFQPFFRGNVRRSQNGLGLGLYIVSEIAKAHDGTIEVSSTENETRFVFTMPLSIPLAMATRKNPDDSSTRPLI
jgi:phosphoserine phosphatase RsbU/P